MGPIHDGADVYYSSIAKVLQDENSDQHCLLSLTEELPRMALRQVVSKG